MNFAICLSRFYISRCDALIKSINKFKKHNIYLLCFDNETYNYFKPKKKIKLLRLESLLKFDTHLKKIIRTRKFIDQIITSRPVFIKFLNKRYNIKKIYLLDSDIFFFSKPEDLMKFTSSSSVAFSEHDFNLKKKTLNKTYGKYNAGFVYIKFDRNGKQFLKEWIGLCKKWCEFNVEKNKFSDQKYLENLKIKIKNVKTLNHPGINLAPWNLENKEITINNNKITVNGEKLIFFHYHGLRKILNFFYILGTSNYNFYLKNSLKNILFKPYINIISNYKQKDYFWSKNKKKKLIMKIPFLFKKVMLNDFYFKFLKN